MFGIIISVIVLITMGYLILKNYKPQVVLAAAGIFLMMCGVWLGFGGASGRLRKLRPIAGEESSVCESNAFIRPIL